MTQKVYSIRYKEGLDVNEPWRFIGRCFETEAQAQAYFDTFYKPIKTIYDAEVYPMQMITSDKTVTVNTYGELAILEQVLGDWLFDNGQSKPFYYEARNLYERVKPALKLALNNEQ